ncbi:hypothetical protein Pelo_19522 [Pelomyxa schiedti]|nr:hypothetical protein Pelo_19522 [Pelomyxa schiedti]
MRPWYDSKQPKAEAETILRRDPSFNKEFFNPTTSNPRPDSMHILSQHGADHGKLPGPHVWRGYTHKSQTLPSYLLTHPHTNSHPVAPNGGIQQHGHNWELHNYGQQPPRVESLQVATAPAPACTSGHNQHHTTSNNNHASNTNTNANTDAFGHGWA